MSIDTRSDGGPALRRGGGHVRERVRPARLRPHASTATPTAPVKPADAAGAGGGSMQEQVACFLQARLRERSRSAAPAVRADLDQQRRFLEQYRCAVREHREVTAANLADVLVELAAIHAGHPGYDPAWRALHRPGQDRARAR